MAILKPTSPPQFTRLSDYVFHYAEERPLEEAIVFGEERISYAKLAQKVELCALSLVANGVKNGDRVAVLSTSRPEHFIVFLATAMIGGVWVGLNPRHTVEELQYVIGDTEPRILFSISGFEQRSYQPVLQDLRAAFTPEVVVTFDGGFQGLSAKYESFLEDGKIIPRTQLQGARTTVKTTDPAAIIYTSGSSGRPKGVVLSHLSLILGYLIQYSHWGVSPLRIVNNLPINHIASLGDLSIYSLIAGGTVIYMERFVASQMLKVLERERISFLQQFPTQFQLLLDDPGYLHTNLSHLRVIAWGGAATSRDLITRLQRVGARLYNSYGLTECGAPIFFTDDNASIDVLADTIGRPDPAYAVRIADELGRQVPSGETGEILVCGKTFMSGYLNKPGQTAETLLADGWLRTGDVARSGADGNYELIGRLKEMYKSGGYSIYPREIETVLERHSAVAMAAVVAVPDPLYQEVGHAFLVAKPAVTKDAAAIAGYCRQYLANYKIPKQFSFLDKLPMLPNGKVDKRALRNFVLQRAGEVNG